MRTRRHTSAMKAGLTLALLFSLSVTAPAQHDASCDAQAMEAQCALRRLLALAQEARKTGRVEDEIAIRQQFSQQAWTALANKRPDSNKLDPWPNRWEIIDSNDLRLALLLEGTHRWIEAEAVYRRNRRELDHEPLAGDDIKSDNQLRLAHLLSAEGKGSEAASICAHWKHRVRHVADFALDAVRNNIPTPPLYDTPEVEIGKWDLACGKEQEGLGLLAQQMEKHPGMLTPYTVLVRHYLASGDFQKAQQTEADGDAAAVLGP